MNQKIKSLGLVASGFLLTACSSSPVTDQSTDVWDRFVYFFAKAIQTLSPGGVIGLGIIFVTLIIRTLLLPLFRMQMASSQKMQDIQPAIQALRAKYPGRDTDSQLKLTEETRALFREHGVRPMASFWPLMVQLPVMLALYQALTRVEALRSGTFLWVDLSQPDPYFILPVLAAVFTFLSSWLTTKAAREKQAALAAMTYVMPLMILLMSLTLASGVTLYWTISNAYQVAQIMIFNNPFKIIAAREQEAQAEKEKQAKIRRAQKKAQRRKK